MASRRPLLCAAVASIGLVWATIATAGQIVLLEVRDTIQPVTAGYIQRGLERADEIDAELVLLELDTPGGLVDSTREITSSILDSEIPVCTYVPTGARAASAGFVILLSSNIAAMAPASNTGAAHPVAVGTPGTSNEEEGDKQTVMMEKATNDLAAMVRSIASSRGRNPEAAEKTVRESVSFTEEEAIEADLIDIVASDRDDLLGQLDGREVTVGEGESLVLSLEGATLVPVSMTGIESFMAKILHPQIVGLLMLAGIVGLGFELTHPGAIFPGVVGAISLLLALYALAILPLNYVGVALLLLAVAFFVAEFNVPSHGLLGTGGAVALVLGSAMLIDAPIPEMRMSWPLFLPTAIVLAATLAAIATRAAQLRLRRPVTGSEGLVGRTAVALTRLDPAGKVFLEGAYWDVVSEGQVPEGGEVSVLQVTGLELKVKPVGNAPVVDESEAD